MEWNKLLSAERLGAGSAASAHRSVFNQDYGRVLYSSAFRRLQDKTQVFPLGRNDYVRTRLTHSLEVSNVGRGLAIELQVLSKERRGRGFLSCREWAISYRPRVWRMISVILPLASPVRRLLNRLSAN